jgi:hypothetical protein
VVTFTREEQRPHAASCRLGLIGFRLGRDENPAGPQDGERARLGLTANQIDDGIPRAGLVLEPLGTEVDHLVGAESEDRLQVGGAGRGDHTHRSTYQSASGSSCALNP